MHDLMTAYVSKDSLLLLFNVINANIPTGRFFLYMFSFYGNVCLSFISQLPSVVSMNGKCNKMLSLYHTFKSIIYLMVAHGKVT